MVGVGLNVVMGGTGMASVGPRLLSGPGFCAFVRNGRRVKITRANEALPKVICMIGSLENRRLVMDSWPYF